MYYTIVRVKLRGFVIILPLHYFLELEIVLGGVFEVDTKHLCYTFKVMKVQCSCGLDKRNQQQSVRFLNLPVP